MAVWHLLPELPIRILAKGTWLHGETPLHPRVESLFCRHVVPQQDGSYQLHLGRDRSALQVDDTAYFARSLEVRGGTRGVDAVWLSLSDGGHEALDPATLKQGADNTLYCSIQRSGQLVPCRLTPHHYHVLALHMEECRGGYALRLGGQLFAVGHR